MQTIVIGGGLAGLTCALHLRDGGMSCQLIEASDDIGGRVRTDEVDGFLLDRGFQVFLTAYPEAAALLDYEALTLRRFEPGALIRHAGKFHRLSDPWRQPQHLLSTALSAAATLSDKLKVAKFRHDTTHDDLEAIYQRPEISTLQLLRQRGFSDIIIKRFFRPFLGGVFLDPKLETSSRMCEFVFRMFSLGDAALPASGMGQIPKQLAGKLPPGTIRTNCSVDSIDGGEVCLSSGERLHADAIVVATDAPAARRLLGDPHPADGRGVRCLYFAADEPPLREPKLVLNGDGQGPINNLCVPSQISAEYAPAGQALVSVTVLNGHTSEVDLLGTVTDQLANWFGGCVLSWTHLRTYSIAYALPVQTPPALDPTAKSPRLREGIFLCGDHCDTGSINGAMASGRRAAEAVLAITR